ncbi:MAG TPA: ATP synthase F1 subunit delta [Polyangia bacterium]|jgi:F-type H+-transporting ATPase subunit delta|nr:ATP synthase F1 subunit delta [Polyangia bacterium]
MALVGSVARRYAKALLEIGVAHKNAEAMGQELDRLVELFQSSIELADTLRNPVFPLSRRRAVLDEVIKRLAFSPQSMVRNFTLLLLDRGRIASLPDIAREYRGLLDESLGRVRVQVTSATPLDGAVESRLQQALAHQTGKTVILEKSVDPALVGGIVSQIGDVVYDGSVRTQLDNLKQQLLAE